MSGKGKLFLGLDCSTQSFSAVAVDAENGTVRASASVNFGKDLPQYDAPFGYVQASESEFFASPLMWLDGLELLFERLAGPLDLSKVCAISGSGQQHASVCLNSADAFSKIEEGEKLSAQLGKFLSREMSPIWMDVSTSQECAEIAEAVGGDEYVLRRTGSVMTERFTGAQIRKFFKKSPQAYAATKRIHLNSSFLCSALAGSDAPIDFGDGAGMNLMSLETHGWDPVMLSATAAGLAEKLPSLVPSDTCVGNISPYFVKKYGFNEECKIVAFTGDNPSSLVGTGAMVGGRATVSLGTSDTFFASAANPTPNAGGHIFGNPAGGFMGLVCIRNGSLAREKMKESLGVDWHFFDNAAFENYSPADDGNIILPFYGGEISPKLKSSAPVIIGSESFKRDKAALVRALVEGQAMNMYVQARKMSAQTPDTIFLTGGAAKSGGIAQTIANVFGARVARLESENSAALGAAMRAAFNCGADSWEGLSEKFCKPNSFKEPMAGVSDIFAKKTARFEAAMKTHYGV